MSIRGIKKLIVKPMISVPRKTLEKYMGEDIIGKEFA